VIKRRPSIGFYRPSIGFHRPGIGYAIAPAIGMLSGAIGLPSIAPYPRADRTAAFGACGARLPTSICGLRCEASSIRGRSEQRVDGPPVCRSRGGMTAPQPHRPRLTQTTAAQPSPARVGGLMRLAYRGRLPQLGPPRDFRVFRVNLVSR
jgi:hypothetical protein